MESADDLEIVMDKVLQQIKNVNRPEQNLQLDFANLEFVGSTGITNFIQTLKNIAQKLGRLQVSDCALPVGLGKLKLLNVRPEFQKLIKAFDKEQDLEMVPSDFSLSLTPLYCDHV